MGNPLTDSPQVSAERVKQEVERWMDVARTAGERTLEAIGLTPVGKSGQPAVDLWETTDAVHIWMDLPGLASDALQISATAHQLTIRVERVPFGEEAGRYHLRERSQPSFERTLSLPATVNPDQTMAQLRDGVLRVTLPKQTLAEPRSVPVSIIS